MKKSLILFLIAGFALAGCNKNGEENQINYNPDGYSMKEIDDGKITVSYFYNLGKEEMEFGSGNTATGSTTAIQIDKIEKGTKATRPSKDPVRVNYDFAGWHTHESEESLYDFNKNVDSNLALYAHWSKTQEDEFVEPEYIEPSKIDDSLDTLVSITGVLNLPVVDGKVLVSYSALLRIENDKNDVTGILNYKVKSDVELVASYDTGTKKISYHATKGSEEQNGEITIQNNTSNLVIENTTYENKAKNYEDMGLEIEDHHIMLAGSSSIENWSHSTEDLNPLTTYNHGIGGTTVEQWKNKLNQRLVYPYSPKTIVYYVGVNNIINTGSSVQFTGESLVAMFDDVHAHLPNTHIYYILINKLPGYPSRQAEFDAVNQYALDYEATHDYVTTLNAGQGLLKENGQPNQAYFLLDGLHMSLCGYAIWGKFIKDKLIYDIKNA